MTRDHPLELFLRSQTLSEDWQLWTTLWAAGTTPLLLAVLGVAAISTAQAQD